MYIAPSRPSKTHPLDTQHLSPTSATYSPRGTTTTSPGRAKTPTGFPPRGPRKPSLPIGPSSCGTPTWATGSLPGRGAFSNKRPYPLHKGLLQKAPTTPQHAAKNPRPSFIDPFPGALPITLGEYTPLYFLGRGGALPQQQPLYFLALLPLTNTPAHTRLLISLYRKLNPLPLLELLKKTPTLKVISPHPHLYTTPPPQISSLLGGQKLTILTPPTHHAPYFTFHSPPQT